MGSLAAESILHGLCGHAQRKAAAATTFENEVKSLSLFGCCFSFSLSLSLLFLLFGIIKCETRDNRTRPRVLCAHAGCGDERTEREKNVIVGELFSDIYIYTLIFQNSLKAIRTLLCQSIVFYSSFSCLSFPPHDQFSTMCVLTHDHRPT